MHQQSSEGISFMCLILLLHPACLTPSLPAGSSLHVCAIMRWKKKRIYAFSKTLDKVRGPETQKAKKKKKKGDFECFRMFFFIFTLSPWLHSRHMTQFCHPHSSFIHMCAQIHTHPKSEKVTHKDLAWPLASTDLQLCSWNCLVPQN